MCIVESSSGVRKPLLSTFASSLQVLLTEASLVSLGLSESISGVEASQRELEDTREALKKAHEL